MKKPWFEESGWFWRPVSAEGWLVVVVTFIFCLWIFRAVDSRSHSVSDTLLGIFPYFVGGLTIAAFIASKSSKK